MYFDVVSRNTTEYVCILLFLVDKYTKYICMTSPPTIIHMYFAFLLLQHFAAFKSSRGVAAAANV